MTSSDSIRKKRLSSASIQAIFTSTGTPLRERRLKANQTIKVWSRQLKLEEKETERRLKNYEREVGYRADDRAADEYPRKISFLNKYFSNVSERAREAKKLRKYNSSGRGAKLQNKFKDFFSVVFSFVDLLVYILGPVFSAVSIWLSVVGIALTIFSGVEPFIKLADWIRFLTIAWRDLTHNIWDAIAPYIGFSIPIDLKDFATFITILFIAFLLGLFSKGNRLVVHEALIGIKMAIYGISHAINTNLSDGTGVSETSKVTLLFHEIDTFLSKNIGKFFFYSVPFLVVFNMTFRVGIVFIPMIILVPERAFEEYLGVTATRVEYLFISACISYFAGLVVLVGGLMHMLFHFIRATFYFIFLLMRRGLENFQDPWVYVRGAFSAANFGLSYRTDNVIRNIWGENYFLARVSASLIRSNWSWFPVSRAESFHRKFDFFLFLSERRFADPAFLDRLAKGLFLFFVLYSFNWISINGENIMNMFQPPSLE